MVGGVGQDRHLNGESIDNKIYYSDQENQSLHHKTTENTEDITSEQNDKTPGISYKRHKRRYAARAVALQKLRI